MTGPLCLPKKEGEIETAQRNQSIASTETPSFIIHHHFQAYLPVDLDLSMWYSWPYISYISIPHIQI